MLATGCSADASYCGKPLNSSPIVDKRKKRHAINVRNHISLLYHGQMITKKIGRGIIWRHQNWCAFWKIWRFLPVALRDLDVLKINRLKYRDWNTLHILDSIDEVCTVGMIWLCTSIKSVLPHHIGMNMSVHTTNITKSIHTATFAQIVRTTPQD